MEGEHSWEEAVASEEAGEDGKASEAGVCGQRQGDGGGQFDDVKASSVPDGSVGDLAEEGDVGFWSQVEVDGELRQAEQEDSEDDT